MSLIPTPTQEVCLVNKQHVPTQFVIIGTSVMLETIITHLISL